MDKIKSALVTGEPLSTKYDQMYDDEAVWLHKGFDGEHTVMLHVMRDLLPGARVIDVGCGAGRLALYAAQHAAFVDGIDFSASAIRLASCIAAAVGTTNVSFSVADASTLTKLPQQYDIALLGGVLEHVDDPVATLTDIAGVLRQGGYLVMSCPGFANFRGHVYMTLLTLFGFPMSLADMRQISVADVRRWADRAGFTLVKTAGALYELGWGKKVVSDMARRVPAAMRDAGVACNPAQLERFVAWMRESAAHNRDYLVFLQGQQLVERIDPTPPLAHCASMRGLTPSMQAYLLEETSKDPWFSTVEPFCYEGGAEIYVLGKDAASRLE